LKHVLTILAHRGSRLIGLHSDFFVYAQCAGGSRNVVIG